MAARFGGDEFLVAFSNIDSSVELHKIIQSLMNSLKNLYSWLKINLTVGVSMGISIFPDHGQELHTLINKADTAMYQAKKQGKNTFRFFDG